MSVFPTVKKGPHGLIGPTNKNHYYSPAYYHGKNAVVNKHKSKWIISLAAEYYVFRIADEATWYCSVKDGLFSILNKGTFIVGSDDEVLSFFPAPSNPTDSWHGFPVKSGKKRPDSTLLDRWVEEKIIDYSARIRIERGQL